jgi:flagellar biosynthesis protein FlhG
MNATFADSQSAALQRDQADGLRRLFAGARTRHIAVAANPDIAFAGLALERLAAACAEDGREVLVVDAAMAEPREMALDLASCIEPLAPRLSYLAARGLPLKHVDSRGSCEGFLQAVADAAPHAAVVIVHADPTDLGRVFARRAPRPLLLAADHPASVTTAYANMKYLAQRHGLKAFDLLLVAAAHSPRSARIANHLSITADRYAGAVLHDWASVDPSAVSELPDALRRVAQGLLADRGERLLAERGEGPQAERHRGLDPRASEARALAGAP